MIIAIGSDHGGFELKEQLVKYLEGKGHTCVNVGCYSSDSINYAPIAEKVSRKVVSGECETGILVCGTGIGISIAANKHNGIRAACCSDTFSARMTRMHNNANVLCMGGRVVGPGLACDMVDLFVDTEFEGGRHQARVDLLTDIENDN